MPKPKDLSEVDFPGETFVNMDEAELDFDRAREAAEKRVHTYDTDPMLLAWYDRRKEKASPGVSCEEEGGDPGWVHYAKQHGGGLTVNINHGEYIFIFREAHQPKP